MPDEVVVERPKNREHGDYATNVALRLAKTAGRPPREVAEAIAARLRDTDGIGAVEVAGPGFLNITLAAGTLGSLAATIVEAGPMYGHVDVLSGRRINLEFVSANPTGPLTLAASRWAAAGDSLARVLEANGAAVTREYYFNDHGVQIDRFARSLLARAHGEPTPEDGYPGQYIDEIAASVVAAVPGVLDLPRDEAQDVFRREGVERMFAEIKTSLHEFGVDFDVFFLESSLHESGAVDKAVEQLKQTGRLYFDRGRLVASLHRVRRRQGPRRHQERRASGLCRCRYRLFRRQARPRLRPLHLPARLRSPRLPGSPQGRGRRARRRPGRHRGAHRPDRAPGQERRARANGQALGQHHHDG